MSASIRSYFLTNADKMKQDLLNLDYLVLSHNHLDHTWGLDPLIKRYTEAVAENIEHKKPVIVTHPDTFLSRFLPDIPEMGSIISKDTLARIFSLQLTREPLWLTEKLVFLGEIERHMAFEAKYPMGKVLRNGVEEDDYLPEDSALVYRANDGLVIITGCSHAGICNIIEQTKKVCQEERVVDIIGGFHLLNPPAEQMQGTVDYLKKLNPSCVHACHCTDLFSKIALSRAVQIGEIGSGICLTFE
ncbi:MAG: MBL fold metallo-hydrolase [Bacillota bacterium]|nr:MBL fold metallo-hydrolase [Bacillota bacterium]